MTETSRRIILEKLYDKKLAVMTLNRPEKRNALDLQMIEEILAALEEIRSDPDISVVLTRANGPAFCSGLDLYYLRSFLKEPPSRDWERSSLPRIMLDTLRGFPKVTVAQVHGYCVAGGMVLMLSHDIACAGHSAQIGMAEILRGSFGQMATATLFHAGISLKKAKMMQLSGRNLSGQEADRAGLVSMALPDDQLEAFTRGLAEEIALRHPAALSAAKIAVDMGGKLDVGDALKLDQLVGAWQQLMVDPTAHTEQYLASQSGGPKTDYRRPDV